MKIHAITNRYLYSQHRDRQDRPAEEASSPPLGQESQRQWQGLPTPAPVEQARATDTETGLPQGYYQAAADFQLEINLHQQLTIHSSNRSSRILASSSQTIFIGLEREITAVNTDFASGFGEAFASQANDMLQNFQETVRTILTQDGHGTELQPAIVGIQKAFATFLNSFSSLGMDQIGGNWQRGERAEARESMEAGQAASAAGQELGRKGGAIDLAKNDTQRPPLATNALGQQHTPFLDRIGEIQTWFEEQIRLLHDAVAEETVHFSPEEGPFNATPPSRHLAFYSAMAADRPAPLSTAAVPASKLSTKV